jgi:adenosylcobyric acid synthase
MNPILLKPTGERASQVVVMGEAGHEVDFADYRRSHAQLRAVVHAALADLRARFDVVVCEGAGGAAEINLMDTDLVNLPLAADEAMRAVVVGDIERGGVFASLFGTVALLAPPYRDVVAGFVINKFRGDASLLEAGTTELERRSGVATLGVVPWLDGVHLDAEDSMALGAPDPWGAPEGANRPGTPAGDVLDVAVLRLPRIANFTDLDPLAFEPAVRVRLVASPAIGDPDLLVIPGTKATVSDLAWMREQGLDSAVLHAAGRAGGPAVLGICGGYQMLGGDIDDDVESASGGARGLGLLDVHTAFRIPKVTRRRRGRSLGCEVEGYEIHHGRVERGPSATGWITLADGHGTEEEGATAANGAVWGTTLHGLFEPDGFRAAFLATVAARRGKRFVAGGRRFADARRQQFDRLADALEAHVDLDALAGIIAAAR